jgi:5-oxoprolinase (ATP-hydrolysing) subunit A
MLERGNSRQEMKDVTDDEPAQAESGDAVPRLDLNCDAGEAFGPWPMGDDAALIPLMTSVNVACGAHAGDPLVMRRTVELARRHGVAVGAHPGYPDLQGFGRRALALSAAEVETSVLAQIGALSGVARALGVALRHVKAHGALYNAASDDPALAEAVAGAVRAYDADLVLVARAGSVQVAAGRAVGLRVAEEAFADRGYDARGHLLPRGEAGALIIDPEVAAERATALVRAGGLHAVDGAWLSLSSDTLCIHSDTPGAAALAAAVRSALVAAGVRLRPLGELAR